MNLSNNSHNVAIVSYYTMRKAVGWLGLLLPVILLTGNFTINHLGLYNSPYIHWGGASPYHAESAIKSSISHYYYSSVGEIFTGTLFAVALFLLAYTGHPLRPGEKGLSDSTMSTLAGLFALIVALIPTDSAQPIKDNLRQFYTGELLGNIHLVFATLFFVTLSFMSIVNFRRSDVPEKFGKGDYHNWYLFYGIAMLSCIFIMFLYVFFLRGKVTWLDGFPVIYTFEFAALIFFGLSWLTKGRTDFGFVPRKLGLVKKQGL